MFAVLFSVWLTGAIAFPLAAMAQGKLNKKFFLQSVVWPTWPVVKYLERFQKGPHYGEPLMIKSNEVVPGVEKPSLILARMVAAAILQYPERVSYESEPVDYEKERALRVYMTTRYHICKWNHPVNGTDLHFKSRSDGHESYIGFVLSFTKQVSDAQAVIDRPYLEEAERKIIINAWKEACRIKSERKKIAQEAERQMKAVGVIEAYFKTKEEIE